MREANINMHKLMHPLTYTLHPFSYMHNACTCPPLSRQALTAAAAARPQACFSKTLLQHSTMHTTAASVGQQGMCAHIRSLQNGKFTSLYMPLGGISAEAWRKPVTKPKRR